MPPSDARLTVLSNELRGDVVALSADIGERNIQWCPEQLAKAADYIEAKLACVPP